MRTIITSAICFILFASCVSNNISSDNASISKDELQTQKLIGKWVGSPKSFGEHVEMVLKSNGTGIVTSREYSTKNLTGENHIQWKVNKGKFHIKITKVTFHADENRKPQVGSGGQTNILELTNKKFVTIHEGDPIKTIFYKE